jgi:hypothetical protein
VGAYEAAQRDEALNEPAADEFPTDHDDAIEEEFANGEDDMY